jgi:hypothetical protein
MTHENNKLRDSDTAFHTHLLLDVIEAVGWCEDLRKLGPAAFPLVHLSRYYTGHR